MRSGNIPPGMAFRPTPTGSNGVSGGQTQHYQSSFFEARNSGLYAASNTERPMPDTGGFRTAGPEQINQNGNIPPTLSGRESRPSTNASTASFSTQYSSSSA